MKLTHDIIQSLDIQAPRYTSYPTAPAWSDKFDAFDYENALHQFGNSSKTVSLYAHIPFCKTLCSFCGCNVIIRRNNNGATDEYLDHICKEIDLVATRIGRVASVKQLHLGGGTPNYLTTPDMHRLFDTIHKRFTIHSDAEIAIEIDPRSCTEETLDTLKTLQFNRLSMGIQDFNSTVQTHINRIQSFEQVERVYSTARTHGFDSINFDLIYGLPGQTLDNFSDTIDKVIMLKPDRIALYSFAYVPWLKSQQKLMPQEEFPTADQKIHLFLQARNQLIDAGYDAIAMDHFALKSDAMATEYHNGKLYRNFMGYTLKPADEFIGFGTTSIGYLENNYIQNIKPLKDYYASIAAGKLPIHRGKRLTEDDIIRKWVIQSMICQFICDKTVFRDMFGQDFNQYFEKEQDHIRYCVSNRLLKPDTTNSLVATELGRLFVRNICMGFDTYLPKQLTDTQFSKTV